MKNRNISVLLLWVVQCCCGWYPTVDKSLDSFWQLCSIDDWVSRFAGDSADRYIAFQNCLSQSVQSTASVGCASLSLAVQLCAS